MRYRLNPTLHGSDATSARDNATEILTSDNGMPQIEETYDDDLPDSNMLVVEPDVAKP